MDTFISRHEEIWNEIVEGGKPPRTLPALPTEHPRRGFLRQESIGSQKQLRETLEATRGLPGGRVDDRGSLIAKMSVGTQVYLSKQHGTKSCEQHMHLQTTRRRVVANSGGICEFELKEDNANKWSSIIQTSFQSQMFPNVEISRNRLMIVNLCIVVCWHLYPWGSPARKQLRTSSL